MCSTLQFSIAELFVEHWHNALIERMRSNDVERGLECLFQKDDATQNKQKDRSVYQRTVSSSELIKYLKFLEVICAVGLGEQLRNRTF